MVADQPDSLHHYTNMQVECPHCQTIFKLTNEQLEAAAGMVRCGLCHEVFNALEDASSKEEEIKEDIEIAEEQAEADKTPEENQRQEDDALVSDNRPDENEVASVSSSVDDLFDGVQSKLIPDEYRIPELHTPYSVWKDISWSVAILLLTVSLFVEYAWFNRNELVANPQLKPWVAKICNFADCEAMALRYPKEIEMVSRNIYSHPNLNNALMVSLTMINHATFAQPFPNVKIDFSDVRGSVVASRTFLPEEYLQLKKKSLRLLPPEATTDISMEIQDPGPKAMTYEFNFL